MKKRNLSLILLISSMLLGCSNSKDSQKSTNEYKNPLNNYEEILVKKSVLENILEISSIQSASRISEDDEKLYANNSSRAISKYEEDASSTTTIYSNQIIINNSSVSSSNTTNGIKITNSYDLKSMLAVLENPQSVISSGKAASKYGLYKKTLYKASSAKEYGVTYDMIEVDFANDDNLKYKWNTYLLNTYDVISSTSFNYFRDDEGETSALCSSSTKTTVTNPIYRYDNTKSITAITSNVSSLILEKADDGYRLKEFEKSDDTDYLSDYYGNSLEDGNVSHSEIESTYFYNKTIFPGIPFESDEYWNLDSHMPMLETYDESGETLLNQADFTNVTRDYQQTYGTDNYAFELTFKPIDQTASYRLTDKGKNIVYSPEKFTLSNTISLKTGDNSTFSFEQTNISYRFLLVLDTKFNMKSVSVSLA